VLSLDPRTQTLPRPPILLAAHPHTELWHTVLYALRLLSRYIDNYYVESCLQSEKFRDRKSRTVRDRIAELRTSTR
jgi:hypothetical protein